MSSPLVDTAWLEANLSDPRLRVLDCSVVMRTEPDGSYSFAGAVEEWQQAHIPGSVFVDVLGKLAAKKNPLPMTMPATEDFAAVMESFGVGDDTEVVLYDRSNHAWAARVWWMLRACGFDTAAVLDGGWKKWTAESRPISDERSAYPRGTLTPKARPDLLATKEQVLASIEAPGVTVINALSPEEHRGTAPTRFPRAGRIAGSTNVYCQSLIDPDTHAYWPAPKLRALFEEAGALSGGRAITYCGAGIAASSDALALTLLGLENVAVYDGSLAEWTADPALPMETGEP
jgi:thiosulfate/3-mercaptopyruvate sulfurtransferase